MDTDGHGSKTRWRYPCASVSIRGSYSLPAIVRERFIGFRHAMHVVALLDCSAAEIGGVVQLLRQLFRHALFGTAARLGDDPTHRQRSPAILRDFDRHLIVGAAHAP